MTPLVDIQRTAHAIAAAYELGLEPPIPHPIVVTLLDDQGAWAAEQPVVSGLAAIAVTRAATKAGWNVRTGSAP